MRGGAHTNAVAHTDAIAHNRRMATVLVTGGSGFLGSYTILQLLAEGHTVRTTVRSLSRERDVRTSLAAGGASPDAPLSFFAADLMSDAGWADAVTGCDFVQHVASPFPLGAPAHDDDIIVPAREGTLRVLRAARNARAKRVVVTSSFAAIGYGHAQRNAVFTEADWTNPTAPGLSAYVRSKAIAERAAWDFVKREGNGMELAVVNPVGILGPLLNDDMSASILMLKRVFEGVMPAVPEIYFGLVDVRDVADLHARAMTNPAANGERFLAVTGDFMSMLQIARVMKERLGDKASQVPTRQMPSWLIRIASLWNGEARGVLPELGKKKNASNEKARRLLGWSPRPREESIAATVESFERLGVS